MTEYGPVLLWTALIAAAVGTYLLRISFVVALGRVDDVPQVVKLALRYVPAAVLAALVLPGLVAPEGALSLSVDNHRLVAGAVAAVVGWRTESMLWTLLVGMGALWTLTLLA